MKLLYCGSGWPDIVDRIRRLVDGEVAVWDRAVPLADVIGDVDVLLPSNARVDAAALAAARRLRLVQQPAAGLPWIDREALRVPMCNAPGANAVAVAECALLLLLMLARRVTRARDAFGRAVIGAPLGIELAGRTLGLVGMGNVGAAIAERARALGMHVRGLTSRSSEGERAAFWAGCDAIVVCCPLTPATIGLVGAREIAAMRPGTLLINVARGTILDRAAVEAGLASGQLGGLGLDVFWEEPWDARDPLFAHPDVVTLPHVAGSTVEAFDRIAGIVAENVRRLATGADLLHRVV